MRQTKVTLDINCDLGEGMPNDSMLMPYLGSCNIACGGHFGDLETIKSAILLAKENHVKVGAHPSYPDKENFGRKSLKIDLKTLEESLLDQITNFEKVCFDQNIDMHHIKPHGALYNDLAKDEKLASFFLTLIQKFFQDIPLYTPPNSIIFQLAPQFNIKTVLEVFADRSYEDDLRLVDRSHSKALLTEVVDVKEHIHSMIFDQKVKTISGKKIDIKAETLCIHGDNPSALPILQMIHSNFSIK
ncbi:5-oxoprolinase subunit PxpA [Belliella baltica]|nr:5-oxoprolinase subunit PxpA [Belliella baltica]